MGEKYKKECKGGEDCDSADHLCKVAGKKDLELIRDLVRDARYFCRKCARSAHSDEHLCKPVEI